MDGTRLEEEGRMNLTTIPSPMPDDRPAAADPRRLSDDELVSFIVSHHHAFLREALPSLLPLAAKVARVHGDHDPRLRELQAGFGELFEMLELHLDQEALLREVIASKPELLRRELAGMREEHRNVLAALRHIRSLSDDYTPPAWACASYRRLLAGLGQLEDDVLRHVQLEADVLLPRLVPRAAP
jgi:regulator of cell morphogenesis and NO signaling